MYLLTSVCLRSLCGGGPLNSRQRVVLGIACRLPSFIGGLAQHSFSPLYGSQSKCSPCPDSEHTTRSWLIPGWGVVTGAQVLFKVTSGTYAGWACLLVPVTPGVLFSISWTCFCCCLLCFCVCFSFAAMSYCSQCCQYPGPWQPPPQPAARSGYEDRQAGLTERVHSNSTQAWVNSALHRKGTLRHSGFVTRVLVPEVFLF